MKNQLWTEKYRPSTVSEYVFTDDRLKEQVAGWINDQMIPHLLLSGDPGTGKTTLAKVLIKELGVEDYDVLEINASRERGIDIVKEKVNSFAQTLPFGKMKIILLDEADYTTPQFQAALRSDMEAYSDSVRFILTCNYPEKIIPALRKSRCHQVHINAPDETEFTARAATVLVSEKIEFDLDTLDSYVRATYPDLRNCLKQLQMNSTSGKLLTPVNDGTSKDESLVEVINLYKSGNILEGRMHLMQYIQTYPTRTEEIYRWMYRNLELWGNSQEKKDASIIIIRNGLANLSLVGIPEIALSATLVELTS